MSINPAKLRAAMKSGAPFEAIPVADCQMLIDAIEIADESAQSDIACNVETAAEKNADGREWFDLSTVRARDRDGIGQSVRYLEARGILVRDSVHSEIVSFRESA